MMEKDKAIDIKVLIVDDEPNILIALEFLMKQEGYTVEKAKDGQAALDLMETFTPDVVILDVMMPRVSGAGVLRFARELRPEIPVLFASGQVVGPPFLAAEPV